MIFRKAILIIHGFGGGTFDQEYLSNYLELQKNFDVFTFTLPGHDYGLGDVIHESWIKSSKEHIEMLIGYGYKNIYLVGHSMGGVIATYIASLYKEVKKLVLVAPAFHYLNFRNDKIDLLESFKSGALVLKEYKMEGVFARFKKLPRKSLKEFMYLVKKYYDSPLFVSAPTLIIQGLSDHVVPLSSSKYVFKNLKSKYKILLTVRNANHDVLLGDRKEEVVLEIAKFLKKSSKKKLIMEREI